MIELVKIEKICLHEEHETLRLEDTCQAIREDGVLLHPPLAIRMKDDRYMIIDGAHRTCALQRLGCMRVPLQVVDERSFTLDSWGHVVKKGAWFDQLLQDPDLVWQAERPQDLMLAEVTDAQGVTLFAKPKQAGHHLKTWHRIVAAYSRDQAVERVADDMGVHLEPDQVLLKYPSCTLGYLEAVVRAGQVVPAGVTRFNVPNRILNLRLPLPVLMGECHAI
jgi:L-serine kinase (ATP) / ParB family transcriptional regulator, heme-responsive regulator